MGRSGKLDWIGGAAAQPRCRPRGTGARTEVEEGAQLLDEHPMVQLLESFVD